MKLIFNFITATLLISCLTRVLTITQDNQKWICNSGDFCVKAKTPCNQSIPHFESQNDCRLSCGKYGAIWPLPTGDCILGHQRINFDPHAINFQIVSPSKGIEHLQEASRNFRKNLYQECWKGCVKAKKASAQVTVIIKVQSASLVLDLLTDESYRLNVKTNKAKFTVTIEIEAKTVFGARHGLETLTNLVTGSFGEDLLLVSSAAITDRPKYPHRGLMLDTARHFFPVSAIYKTLEAMAASKLNVFHWHATDYESFPLNIPSVPEMSRYGAFSPDQVYSRRDVKKIVDYAKQLGIRVIMEIDGPSHAGSGWQWGPKRDLGILSLCQGHNILKWQLNPLNKNVYDIISKIYQYLTEILEPNEIMHVGGDEVNLKCWESLTSEKIDLMQLWSNFHRQNLESYDNVTGKLHSGPKNDFIIWDSTLTNPKVIKKYLPKERYIIQAWKYADDNTLAALREMGYRIIISNKWFWYLNHGLAPNTQYHNWRTMYDFRIDRSSLTLGGETCLWAEYMDQYCFESRIWPRAGVVAERLWSDPDTDSAYALLRFNRYRDRLIARGCQPEVTALEWCVRNEGQCDKLKKNL